MESIKIDFVEDTADGLRRLTKVTSPLVCLVISRDRLAQAIETGKLTHPGIYVLVGPSKISTSENGPTLVFDLYIGESNALDERIQTHHRIKDFWSIAFAFHREGEDELHAGQIADLEAHLISKVWDAGHNIINQTNPGLSKKLVPSDITKIFSEHIETTLKAFGYDFFTKQQRPDTNALAPPNEPDIIEPKDFQRLVDEIKSFCLKLPSTEFYKTYTPDLRAKVISNGRFRVFAQIVLRRHVLRLNLRNQVFILKPHMQLDESLEAEIKNAYSQALQQLEN
jgi:hypothetical protein